MTILAPVTPHGEDSMSGTDSALRSIEATLARLCRDLGDPAAPPDDDGTLAIQRELRQSAWGPNARPMDLARVQSLARGLPGDIAVDVSALASPIVFSAPAGRIVLNLLLLAAGSLPAGGTIILAGAADDLFVRIAGPAAAWPAGLAICLSSETEARSALTGERSVQMAITALLARATGIRLSVVFAATARNEPAILRLGG